MATLTEDASSFVYMTKSLKPETFPVQPPSLGTGASVPSAVTWTKNFSAPRWSCGGVMLVRIQDASAAKMSMWS